MVLIPIKYLKVCINILENNNITSISSEDMFPKKCPLNKFKETRLRLYAGIKNEWIIANRF